MRVGHQSQAFPETRLEHPRLARLVSSIVEHQQVGCASRELLTHEAIRGRKGNQGVLELQRRQSRERGNGGELLCNVREKRRRWQDACDPSGNVIVRDGVHLREESSSLERLIESRGYKVVKTGSESRRRVDRQKVSEQTSDMRRGHRRSGNGVNSVRTVLPGRQNVQTFAEKISNR